MLVLIVNRNVLAEQLGAAIATQGWTTMTGGYGGLMEVVSRTAAEAGGLVIGLPMSGWSNLTPNPWSHELRWSQDYPERLGHLLAADAVVALDGGIGTVSEATVVWAARQTEPTAPDLIFLGAGWRPVLQSIATSLVVDDRDLAYVAVCTDPESVIARIAQNRSRLGAVKPRG
jgi:predicted Rossmann-fold nucleotide-binding protein